jgi:hypothetical protein
MKLLYSLALIGVMGCASKPLEHRLTVRTHVENCFLNNWTFVDAKGYITYREIEGSPFDCEIFNNSDVELTTEGNYYIHARFIYGDDK